MCCAVEIGMMVFGIITLVRGRFQLTGNKVVSGAPAYIIGAILTATLPLLFVVGMGLGLMLAMKNPGRPPDVGALAFLDFIIVPVVLVIVLVIALATAREPQRRPLVDPLLQGGMPLGVPPTQPMDPNNPYAPPQWTDNPRPPMR